MGKRARGGDTAAHGKEDLVMTYAHRIWSAIRTGSRACGVAIASFLASVAAWGAALPPGL